MGGSIYKVGHELFVPLQLALQTGCYDYRCLSASDGAYGPCGASGGVEVVESRSCNCGDVGLTLALQDIVPQFAGHGNLRLRRFAQRDADGVTQSVCQQRTDTQGALDASILTIASFGHAQVEREVHPLALHHVGQQAHRADHDHCVGGLDGDDHVHKLLLYADAQELHARLHHALGRITVARHDAVAQRAVVHADADGGVVFLAYLQEGHEALADFLNLGGILLVGIFQVLEGTGSIHVVARVDAHLLGIACSHIGHAGIEVNIGHEGYHAPLGTQGGVDGLQVFGLAHPLGGETHIFTSGLHDAERLLHAGLSIHRNGIGHALQPDGVVATQRRGPHVDGHGGPTRVIEEIHSLVISG